MRATSANGINPRGEIVGLSTVAVHDPAIPLLEDSALDCPSAGSPPSFKGFLWQRAGAFKQFLNPSTRRDGGSWLEKVTRF